MDEIRFPCVVPFDIDKHGRGPCDARDKVKTIYQVWDDCWSTLAEFDTEQEAKDWFRDYLPQSKPSDPMGK